MPRQLGEKNEGSTSGMVWMVFFAVAAVLIGLSTTMSAIVGVVVAGLILAGLAALKSSNDKAAARVPVRVKVEPRRRHRS